MAERLSDEQVSERLGQLDGWDASGGRLRKVYRFEGYGPAFGFTSQLALLAERHGHHPDVTLSYGRVIVELTTHDAGGLTERDFELATAIDGI